MRRLRNVILAAAGGVLMIGAFTAPAQAATPAPRCSAIITVPGGTARACIREYEGGVFQAYTEISTTESVLVETNLVQCGSTCAIVTTSGQFQVTGHRWIYTNPLDGAHGHSYAGQSDISTLPALVSPYIAYP